MLSVVEVAKTPPQIFDRLSAFIAEIFPSTSLRQAQGKRSGNVSRLILLHEKSDTYDFQSYIERKAFCPDKNLIGIKHLVKRHYGFRGL